MAGMAMSPERTSPTSSRDQAETEPERLATSTNFSLPGRGLNGTGAVRAVGAVEIVQLDLPVPGGAVETWSGEQVIEAGREHGHRHDEGDCGGGGEQRGPHRDRCPARPRFQPETDPDDSGTATRPRPRPRRPPETFAPRSPRPASGRISRRESTESRAPMAITETPPASSNSPIESDARVHFGDSHRAHRPQPRCGHGDHHGQWRRRRSRPTST